MNEDVLAILLFGSAFGLIISGIPIWCGLALWLPNKMIGQPQTCNIGGGSAELARTCRQVATHIDYGVNNAN